MTLSAILTYLKAHALIAALTVLALAVVFIAPAATLVLHLAFLPVKLVAPVFVLAILLLVILVAYVYFKKGKAAAVSATTDIENAGKAAISGNIAAVQAAVAALQATAKIKP